jgi:hypothetical protein
MTENTKKPPFGFDLFQDTRQKYLFLPSNMNTRSWAYPKGTKNLKKKNKQRSKPFIGFEPMTYHVYFSFCHRIFIFINDFHCISSKDKITILTRQFRQ